MANYLLRYKGQYRLKCPIDEFTNDFPKTLNGLNEDIDVFIKCKKGEIYNYGHGILVCYCDKLGSGRNVLKALGKEIGVDINKYTTISGQTALYDYEGYYKALEETKVIWDIIETDEEVEWKFKAKDIELMAKYMQAQTSGASISPFSTKNLPRAKYEIPVDDLNIYREVTKGIDQNNMIIIGKATRSFISDIPDNYKKFKNRNIREMQRKSCLKGKEFIHSIGLWADYINYLKENVNASN